MNCVASAYDVSGKLVGCAEPDLNAIISAQLYTVFALGTGLYLYKTFTADNWADIVLTIGWGCVSLFTRTKRAFTKHALPGAKVVFNAVSNACKQLKPTDDDDSAVSDDDYPCIHLRVVKDGVDAKVYSSVFSFVKDLDEHYMRAESDIGDADADADADLVNVSDEEGAESEADAEADADADAEEDISEVIKRIESHSMQFDFVLSEVPTVQTAVDRTAMHVMKYDGFPRDSDGVHFYDRRFVPVDHRMMEIVLHYDGQEYDLNLAAPDNFYVAGNKLLDPAFLKWFVLKNHNVHLAAKEGSDGTKYNYTIKIVDHDAVLHTLLPHNYLYVSISGFEVQDSGLV
jgi:hypothetical protein